MFLLDIIMMFFTTYRAKKGNEVSISKKIAINYVKTWRFFFDVGALLSASIFTELHDSFKVFGFFKMVRVQKLAMFIKMLNLPEQMKAYINFFKLMFYLFLYLNIQASVWYYVVMLNSQTVMQV